MPQETGRLVAPLRSCTLSDPRPTAEKTTAMSGENERLDEARKTRRVTVTEMSRPPPWADAL